MPTLGPKARPVIVIRIHLCIVLVLALTTILPSAFADSTEEDASTEPASGTCYEVNPYSTPPVYVYECQTDP